MRRVFVRSICLMATIIFLGGFSFPPQGETNISKTNQSENTAMEILKNGLHGMRHEHKWLYLESFPSAYDEAKYPNGVDESVFVVGELLCIFCKYCGMNLTEQYMFHKEDIMQHLSEHDIFDFEEGTYIDREEIALYFSRYPCEGDEIKFYHCPLCGKRRAEFYEDIKE